MFDLICVDLQVLGKRLKYSSTYWPEEVQGLEEGVLPYLLHILCYSQLSLKADTLGTKANVRFREVSALESSGYLLLQDSHAHGYHGVLFRWSSLYWHFVDCVFMQPKKLLCKWCVTEHKCRMATQSWWVDRLRRNANLWFSLSQHDLV